MSSLSVLSSTSINSSGEKSRMKQFINAAQEYSRNKSEQVSSVLSRSLQLISVSIDINTFDPNSSVVSEFFVSLHELMSGLDSRNPLSWFAVSVLQQACRNKSAHKALIHTYQFLPILSRLLGDHLARDKKQKLLTLMQELSYGINISWQISYLPHLLQTLTKWIESGDEGVTCLSLGLLLNLCHKNLPVIYTLMRTVNTKHFLKTIMAMKNPATDVQVCKLLIILEHINGEVPKEDILQFVRVTFRTIVEAFRIKDLIRLRHIVEFFLDVRNEKNSASAVILYNNYYDDVVKILNAVENNLATEKTNEDTTDLECMALLFEFLHSLIELKIPDLRNLHSRMVNLSLGWVQTELVSSKSLALLKSIAVQPENKEHQEHQIQILEPLASGLSVLLHIIDTAVPAGGPHSFTHGEQCRKFTALLQLLRILASNQSFQNKVLTNLKQSSISKLFDALLESEDNNLGPAGETHLRVAFTTEINELYVHTIALVAALAKIDLQWDQYLNKIFSHKQVHAVLANTFYFSCEFDTKMLVFEMAKCREFPTLQVSQIMTEIQPANIPPQACKHQNINYPDGIYSNTAPIISGTQLEQLDKVINKLTEALNNNQVQSVATSEVMELYEFKMAAIGHAERAAQASLEAASQNVTHLQHRLAQVATEVTRLHQLLFHAQQCNEESKKHLKIAEESMATTSAKLTKEKIKTKELTEQLSSTEKSMEDHVSTIKILEQKVNENLQNISYLTKKYEDTVNKNIALVKASKVIENNIITLKSNLDEKSTILVRHAQTIDDLNKQVRELEELRKFHVGIIADRDKELSEIHKELEEKRRILDTITKLTKA